MTIVATRPWVLDAACRGMDPDRFYPRPGESLVEALTVCASCSVRRQCLDHALARPERIGIWGGTSGAERRRILADRRSTGTATPWREAS